MEYVIGKCLNDPRFLGINPYKIRDIYKNQVLNLSKLHSIDVSKSKLHVLSKSHDNYINRTFITWKKQ